MLIDKIKKFYENRYKLLMLLPILLLIGALVQIGVQTAITGDFVHKGISLKGGSTLTLNSQQDIDPLVLESFLKENYPQADISVRTLTSAGTTLGLAIDTDVQENAAIQQMKEAISTKFSLNPDDLSAEIMDSALGSSFFKQTMIAIILAFVLMALVVFIYFRNFVPSLIIVLCAFSDIVVTLALFNLTGMKLTTGGIAAFLMLIGYSVDTDMLLTSRVLKRKEGTIINKTYSSIKTGMTMTLTALIVVLVAMILVHNEVIKQIMLIIFIGLIVDMIMTWIQNVSLLRIYLEKKGVK